MILLLSGRNITSITEYLKAEMMLTIHRKINASNSQKSSEFTQI